ncbi:hypothetical protein SCHPADRAFT_865872 [Schizopora paradoxa]|uniref:Nudix hydrolase domain-containing protein n=1 Tax=Schizopora paradoxa TaxID=27342 RepID=A0A0H2S3X9_9AGAM|nr:hypothetical protein SCHPADRAFT_865872 [Schizopora paradoxa]
MKSFLPVLEVCDNFNPIESTDLVPFYAAAKEVGKTLPIGLLKPETVALLVEDNKLHEKEEFWVLEYNSSSNLKFVAFAAHLNTPDVRSKVIQEMCRRWHETGVFANVIGGRLWRNELYAVYANPFKTSEEPLFEMERVTAALFGVVTYGVHMTVYHPPAPGSNEEMKIWVARRALTKQTFPGLYDNTCAGGMVSGMGPLETLCKESFEEASIPEEITKKYAQCTGAVSYYFQTGIGWLQPEVEYTYELAIPHNLSQEELKAFTPTPQDGEVSGFELLPVSEVIDRMHQLVFKPNCAVVLIDFLMRHNIITPENELNYLEIMTRMHGRFDIEQWGRKAV